MTKLLLVCSRCSTRLGNLDPGDIPARGIVCRCGNRIQPGEAKADTRKRLPPAPAHGPGTELKNLLAELGITSVQGCGCDSKVAMMNRWGVEGCRERFGEIRQWLVNSRGKASWTETIRAAVSVMASGLHIDPLDAEGSLVRIAIERSLHVPS